MCKEGVLPLAISPDGTTLVYQTRFDNKNFTCKRFINQSNTEIIPGTEGALNPFFSPDGKWIAFYANGFLKKILGTGGESIELCAIPICTRGIWLPDNTIIISLVGIGLVRIPASGGEYIKVTSITTEKGEWFHLSPIALSDGKTILYGVTNASSDPLYIKSINLETNAEKLIIHKASHPIYSNSGYLLYAKDGHLMASPFNMKQLRPFEPAVVIIENIVYYYPNISLSNNGTLAYVPDQDYRDELVWLDMNGNTESIFKDSVQLWGPRISSDGKKIALWKTDLKRSHIYDLYRQTLNKLTNSGGNFWPVWSPDGKNIAFPTLRDREFVEIYWKEIDKSSLAESLLNITSTEEIKEYIYQPQMWTSDERFLLFVKCQEFNGNWDIMMLDMTNNKISEFIATEYLERHPRLSPDNKWVAYQSNESGLYEIYVTKFPGKGARWQISSNGGTDPLWSPDGRKIYYRKRDDVISVDITYTDGLKAGKPEVIFSGKFRQLTVMGWYYDIHPDGDKFVMVKAAEIGIKQNHIKIYKNFTQEIENKFASAL